jgi:hypothetical protein
MPANVVEIPINLTELTTAPNRSAIFPLNNAQRATLIVQTGPTPTAGSWVLKTLAGNDSSVGGQALITTNFPPSGRVNSASADVCHQYGYVEQVTPCDVALQKVSVYLR